MQLKKSWFWVVRRLVGVIAPLIVLALAVMIFLMFSYVPQDEAGMIDVAIAYGAVLISPMGLLALAGYLCANSTRGHPAPLLGKASSIINLALTAVLIIPAVCILPFFLLAAPVVIPELIAWIGR
jgi:hypothetical protein